MKVGSRRSPFWKSLSFRVSLALLAAFLANITLLIFVTAELLYSDADYAEAAFTTATIASDEIVFESGAPRLPAGGATARILRDNPSSWLATIQDGGISIWGPVPEAEHMVLRTIGRDTLSFQYNARRDLGTAGAMAATRAEIAGKEVVIAAGGIDYTRISFGDFWRAASVGEDVSTTLFVGIFFLLGVPIAAWTITAALRPASRSIAALDPARTDQRIAEDNLVNEMRPVVRAFNEALDRVAEAAEQRKRFIADVAHELRTPLAVLTMQIEGMPENRERAEAQRTVFRLGEMVGQMLDAERLALGERNQTRFDLAALARQATADVTPLAMANGYDVAFLAPDEPVEITGDPHSSSRAILNLLGNAIAHAGGSGTIEVRVGDSAVVEVEDQGPGVPVEARERIFEPFHRERWDRDGCGLGLYLVREIMEAQGGSVEANGNGSGAVFRLRFNPAD